MGSMDEGGERMGIGKVGNVRTRMNLLGIKETDTFRRGRHRRVVYNTV